MTNSKINIFLESILSSDTSHGIKLTKLEEAEKIELTKGLVDSVYHSALEKSKGIDYGGIPASKGDITAFKEYANLRDSIHFLRTMQMNLRKPIAEVDTLENAMKNLINNKHNFGTAFRMNNNIGILLYNNMALALVSSTSFIISTMVDYVREPNGTYTSHFRNNVTKDSMHTIALSNLETFNNMVVSGEMDRLFTKIFAKENFAGTIGATAITFIAVGAVIVPLLRELVFQFFNQRVKLADYIYQQAKFVDLNRNKLRASNGDKEIIAKQGKIVERLTKLADTINVDQKVSTRKAQNDVTRGDKEITLKATSNFANNDDNLF